MTSSCRRITPTPCFGLDRTNDGGKVHGVELKTQGGATQLFPKRERGAGQVPAFGPTDYDMGLFPDGSESGDFAAWQGSTALGGSAVVHAYAPPNRLAVWVVGQGNITPQFQVPIIPLTFVSPQFYLPLDPFNSLMLCDITPPFGPMDLPINIPMVMPPMQLMMQAVLLDPAAPNLLGSAQRTQGLVVRIGQ